MDYTAKLTVFTATVPEKLGKVFEIREGTLVKTVAGNLSAGTYGVKAFTDAASLIALLQSVGVNQAISASLPINHTLAGDLTIKDKPRDGALARTKEHFYLAPEPGLMILDYDPDNSALSKEALYSALLRLCPSIADSITIWWCSGSSYINGPDGELQGLRGQRLYIPVLDASDLQRAGDMLTNLCWLNGLGGIKLSKRGDCLKRTLFDVAMFEPARLDFIGGSICVPPVFQTRPPPENLGGTGWFDTRKSLPTLPYAQLSKVKTLQKQAKDKAEPEAAVVHAQWAATEAPKISIRLQQEGVDRETADMRAANTVRSAKHGTLLGDYQIPMPDGTYLSVQTVLDNRVKYDKVKTLDIANPAHRGGEACGILFLSGSTPCLYTFAHGGITYKLVRQQVSVDYDPLAVTKACEEIAEAVVAHGDVYKIDDERVVYENGRFRPLDAVTLQYLAYDRVAYTRKTADGLKPVKITTELIKLVDANIRRSGKTDEIQSVTSLPYATLDRLVTVGGYDRDTKVYNMMAEDITIKEKPTKEDCIAALKVLWKPWSEYIWASNSARAGMMAGIFTAVLRPAMPIALGFFFDAPVVASGKTKAALALGALTTGSYAPVTAFVPGNNQETEYGKVLIAMLRGTRRFMLIDNIYGVFDSKVLASMLTSGKFEGRILGESVQGDYHARILKVATGNNATLGEDLARRYIVCRIDANVDDPSKVNHSFEPSDVAIATRYDIAKAVLTIVQAYRNDERVQLEGDAGYRDWSMLVREPVVWLHKKGMVEEAGIGIIGDPVEALGKHVATESPEVAGLHQLIRFIKTTFKKKETFTARQIYNCWVEGGLTSANERLQTLRDAFENLTPGRPVTAVSIGKVLAYRKDKMVEGVKLEQAGANADKTVLWRWMETTA